MWLCVCVCVSLSLSLNSPLNFSEFTKGVAEKEELKNKYRKVKKDLISKYQKRSTFHISLESAYDEDVQVYIHCSIICLKMLKMIFPVTL